MNTKEALNAQHNLDDQVTGRVGTSQAVNQTEKRRMDQPRRGSGYPKIKKVH